MAKAPVFAEEDFNKKYVALPTLQAFHASNAFFRGVMGPVGSGKTVGCVMELYTRGLEQRPFHGVRRSRFALIRTSYPELVNTTLKTFQEWIPAGLCPITRGITIGGTLRADLPDGTRAEIEFIFLAMDIDDDAKKLKSLELTGAFLNEASEVKKPILDLLTTRVDRYPAKISGGTNWSGIIADTNPPDDSHWWYKMAEIEKPEGYQFWKQPPAMIKLVTKKDEPPEYVPNDGSRGIPAAENIENHNSGFNYYTRQIPGKDVEWIKVFVLGEYGSIFTGKLVYPDFSDTMHVAKEELKPHRGLPLIVGFDFGLTPSCVFVQLTLRGQLRVLDELTSVDMGIERFARDIVTPFIKRKYSGMQIQSVGDPAGVSRSQSDETTCFQILAQQGLPTEPAPTNNPLTRIAGVTWFLTKLVDGEPGFLLSPNCQILRKGFLGGYHYRKVNIKGVSDRFAETPDKNEFAHLADSLQYACGFLRSAGSGSSLANPDYSMAPVARKVKHRDLSPWT